MPRRIMPLPILRVLVDDVEAEDIHSVSTVRDNPFGVMHSLTGRGEPPSVFVRSHREGRPFRLAILGDDHTGIEGVGVVTELLQQQTGYGESMWQARITERQQDYVTREFYNGQPSQRIPVRTGGLEGFEIRGTERHAAVYYRPEERPLSDEDFARIRQQMKDEMTIEQHER